MPPHAPSPLRPTRASRRLCAALALLLIAPGAPAAWSIQGATEPDTPPDRAGFMWLEPDQAQEGARIYFSGMAFQGYGHSDFGLLGARVNPNVLEGARMAPHGSYEIIAYLGIWKDCNRDGFVGHAQSSLWQYRSELLLDASVCPVGSQHRDLDTVNEFLWIGTDPIYGDTVPGTVHDPSAGVWGDLGGPGAPARPNCNYPGLPRGTTASSGALLGYADCATHRAVARTLSGQEGPLAFEDPERPGEDCDHPANVRFGLFANPRACEGDPPGMMENGTGEPTLRVWDCNGPAPAVLRDPTAPEGERGALSRLHAPLVLGLLTVELANERGEYLRAPAVRPEVDPTRRGVYDAAHEANGWPQRMCGQHPHLSLVQALMFGPEYPRMIADPNRYESDSEQISSGMPKTRPDFVLAYSGGYGSLRPRDESGMTYYGGLYHLEAAFGTGWISYGEIRGPPAYDGTLVRSDAQPAGPAWFTFYARVGEASLVRASPPSTSAGTYGSEACGGHRSGEHGGWDCDPARWWDPRHGIAPRPGVPAPVPGTEYRLRDVDCLDGTLFAGGPQASLVAWSGVPACPAP